MTSISERVRTRAPAQARVVVADDLTGAAEVAAHFGRGTPVLLWPAGAAAITGSGTLVLDADIRALPPAEASARTASILEALDPAAPAVIKTDSLLRGPLAAVVGALATPDRVVVVVPALPALGRTILGGVLLIDGVPLAETDAWSAEPTSPPGSVLAALFPLDCVSLGLDRVRGEALTADLAGLRGRVTVCDAQTDDDLGRIAAAIGRVLPAAAVGASALSRAFFGAQEAELIPPTPSVKPCLVIVGTAVAAVADQVTHLIRETGATQIAPTAASLLAASNAHLTALGQRLDDALARGDVVLRFADRPWGGAGPSVASALAALVAQCESVQAGAADMILTGGQTARSVLDALGVDQFTIVAEVRPGAIISRLPSGVLLGTRPGSFGGLHSLLELRLAMGAAHSPDLMRSRP